jgi:predicted O-linked N-acetylglucosamine transferase (SPINDLY family)
MTEDIDHWIRQGLEHEHAGGLDEAVALYRRVLEMQPAHREAPFRLIEVLQQQGRISDAILVLEAAVGRCPDAAALHCALADVLHAQADRAGAIAIYRRALAIEPALEGAWWGLGCALAALEDHPGAAESFQRLTAIRPDHGQAWHNLGKSLFELGQVNQALDAYANAANHLPAEARCQALSNVAVIIPGSPARDNRLILDARRAWAHHCLPACLADKVFPARTRLPVRRLRVGYVSAFFARHNWMKPVWGVLQHHDRERFEVFVFSDGSEPQPEHGYRKDPVDRLHNTNGLSNRKLAGLIEEDEIDILVDLNSFSWRARLPIFTLRPAPIQVAWFNSSATSGMPCFDALIGDDHVIPPEEEIDYAERIIRVPGSYLAFQVPYLVPEVGPPPCLARGDLTFGCLAPQYKIIPEVVAAWSRILRESPGSRLVLKNTALGQASVREFVCGLFESFSISADRLYLDGPDEHFTFLKRYDDIDIALDTFPYNGGTTTTEAIWQGVPVLTFAGDRWVARTSASLLREAGLAEFVARDVEEFVERGIKLAGDPGTPARLDTLRRNMRCRLRAAPVCDVVRLTRSLEEIYLRLWQEYCDEPRLDV